ncbi:MAG TPA: MlaD family protein [Acidimicrobiia bacterium]|nr:MlaD family protein [Acidimicrobiia bacterium]
MSGLRRLLLGALVPAVLVGATFAGPDAAPAGGGHGVTITAVFADAGAILPGNDVRVDGVPAGLVKKVRLVGGRAQLTLSVGGAFTPLHTDATANIRPVSLLGERFVDLDRGSPGAPLLANGGVIPVTQTRRAVDLSEVLDAVDDPTGDALAALIVGLGQGVDGRGADAGAALDALAPALTKTTELLQLLGSQNDLLGALVDKVEPVASALGTGRGQRMDQLVGSADALLGATAAARPQLEEALKRLPDALTAARGALTQLAGFADQTTPVLESLKPVTGDLRQIAGELQTFADAAGPALSTLGPVLQKGNDLITAARPVASELAAAGGDLQTVAKSGRTLVEAFPPDLSNLLDFVRNFAVATAGADGVSHYLRIFIEASSQAVDGLLPVPTPVLGQPTGIPAAGLPAAITNGLAGNKTPLLPSVGGLVNGVTGTVGGLLGGTGLLGGEGLLGTVGGVLGLTPSTVSPAPNGAAPAPADPGSATGLTATQEHSLLDYLLGGR